MLIAFRFIFALAWIFILITTSDFGNQYKVGKWNEKCAKKIYSFYCWNISMSGYSELSFVEQKKIVFIYVLF
jgi:hypothetical protein